MSEFDEQKQEVAKVEPEQSTSIEIENISKTKKTKGLITASTILLVFAIIASFFLTEIFVANLDILSRHDLSVLVIIIMLPFFIIVCFGNLLIAVPGFGIALGNVIQNRFKDPVCIILFVANLLAMLYPIVLFLILIFGHSSGGSGTSSSSIDSIEEVSSAIAYLIY